MDYNKYDAIILSKVDIAETDRIYTIYTKESGKIKALGKGVRKPMAKLSGNLEPITKVEILIARNKGIGKIASAIALEPYLNIKANLEALKNIFYVFQVLEKIMPEEEKEEKIYLSLSKLLEICNKSPNIIKEKIETATLGFLFSLLDISGYRLETNSCIKCRRKMMPQKNYFSVEDGGFLCQNCHNLKPKGFLVTDNLIKTLRVFAQNKIENLPKLKINSREIKNLWAVFRKIFEWLKN